MSDEVIIHESIPSIACADYSLFIAHFVACSQSQCVLKILSLIAFNPGYPDLKFPDLNEFI